MLNTSTINAETESYWNLLKNVRREVKLHLIARLSQSVVDDSATKSVGSSLSDDTAAFLARFDGAWKGNESAESIISTIHENRSCKAPIHLE